MTSATPLHPFSYPEIYADSRWHGYKGPNRFVRYPRVTSAGSGCIAKSEDGVRCAVAGKESLRILRISDGSLPASPEFRSVVGRGGHRIDATRNLWEGCGLKVESATTGIAWGRGPFSNKLFTSARNGELILWDVGRAGSAKLERRTKDHIRSINQLAISHSVHHYCVTGSADGDLRIWDLRDMTKSLMRVHHPTSVRSVAFSPSLWQPLQAIVGLDNGSIYRWDLKMGQRGQLDRLLVAHTTPVTSLSWRNTSGTNSSQTADNGLGWFASGALDRCVKVWDMTAPGSASHIPSKPTYTLHPRYPVRNVLWRPGYDCELVVVSSPEFSASKTDVPHLSNATPAFPSRPASAHGLDNLSQGSENDMQSAPSFEAKASGATAAADDAIEIWDVRRGWIAKWSVSGSGAEGNLTDVDFFDPHAIWALHSSGGFSQFDLRDASKPIDAIPRVALTWEALGSITFVSDNRHRFEVPYDDIRTEAKALAEKVGLYIKGLGDPPVQPQAQNIGTQLLPHANTDLTAFKILARKYILIGENRKSICIKNAQAAIEVGKEECAQLWLLLAACLEEIVPQILPIRSQIASPQGINSHPLPTPASARYSQSYFPLGGKSPDNNQPQKISPGRKSTNSTESPKYTQARSSSQSASRHLTPASSASSSPRHGHTHLPPITPRRPSFFSQRNSMDSSVRRPSNYRRPSAPSSAVLNTPTVAPEKDKSVPTSNLRHVGDHALDDSDSSSGNDSDIGSVGTAGNWSDDEPDPRLALTSPTIQLHRSLTAPSPLSRVAGKHRWTDEECGANDDEATSPSPQSTDSELDGPVGPVSVSRRPSNGRRLSARYKSRSRSSTVACLAAPTAERTITRKASVSSVSTVVAGDLTHAELEEGLKAEGTMRDLSSRLPEAAMGLPVGDPKQEAVATFDRFTERRIQIVQMEEKRIRDSCLQILRQALEMLADNGDIQMCAMFAIIARSELLISIKRSIAFVDAYVDKLDRLRSFACSAYVRKHCQLKDVQDNTMTHTSISTSCGRCHKPLLKPSGRLPDGSVAKGGYSHCLTCKAYVSCAICRLPVRTLFFQCTVCKHGAHERCHRQFYGHHRLSKPLSDGGIYFAEGENHLNPIFHESLAREASGYPCPAGCGHHCYIRPG